MVSAAKQSARQKLLPAAIERFRRNGYVATTVDDICAAAGVTKGAFFHHFDSKEAIAEACLEAWTRRMMEMDDNAPYRAIDDPVERLVACMNGYIAFFGAPALFKSCLVGTTVQEVAETHPALREAANACFKMGEARFKATLDAARAHTGAQCDTASLASMWMATLQGALILHKASRDEDVVRLCLEHARTYIAGRIDPARTAPDSPIERVSNEGDLPL